MFRSFVRFLESYSILIGLVAWVGLCIGALYVIAETPPHYYQFSQPTTMVRPYLWDLEPPCRGNSGEPIAVPYRYWHEIGV